MADFGKVFEQDGVRLVLHPRTPLKVNLLLKQLTSWGIASERGEGACYAILEGFALRATAPSDTGIGYYLATRSKYEGLARFEHMTLCLDADERDLLIDAVNSTRDAGVTMEGTAEEKKDSSSPT